MVNNTDSCKVQFNGVRCRVVYGTYSKTNQIAIRLFDDSTGEPVAMATVQLKDVCLVPNEVAIKDYAENSGILRALTDAGIIAPAREELIVGFCEYVYICPLLGDEWATENQASETDIEMESEVMGDVVSQEMKQLYEESLELFQFYGAVCAVIEDMGISADKVKTYLESLAIYFSVFGTTANSDDASPFNLFS